MGGSVAAIESGFMQDQIAQSAYEYQRQIETGQKIIVGVNRFENTEQSQIPLLKIDDTIRQVQTEKLTALRSNRNNTAVSASLSAIQQAATDGSNLMPPVIEAVENLCTLGEIADALRTVFGEYQ
ncbi:MAG TPA: methylmalonyl-CoA mutase family protein, partial [Phnomibacter sp.]|nr:methylmalonyl-CoA mutase family protein [Phnomibacter sp.]